MRTILILFSFAIIACNTPDQKPAELGVVEFPVSGNDKAEPLFQKGLLLLHSFEYEDAREAFIKAQEMDPAMSMAYWGEAMSYNHSLWDEQDYEKGVAALEKLKRIDDPKMEATVEQDLIKAVHILYDQNVTDKFTRDKFYAEYLSTLHEKYPQNHEIAAFYSLSLLGSVPEGRDSLLYGKGAKIAQSILDENPEHPGALHYLIHSYDDPEHAKFAVEAAFRYAQVAPDASHALHMPSHIFVALGMWDEVIRSNVESYKASVIRMNEKDLDNDARGYHSYHWLEYAYLQKGMIDSARHMVYNMQNYVKQTPSKRARVHLVFLKGTFLSETGLWEEPISDIVIVTKDLNITVRAQDYTLQGMKAYHDRDRAQLDLIIDSLRSDIELESFNLKNGGAKMCAGSTRQDATQFDLNMAIIMESQLKALRAWLSENDKETEKQLLAAVNLDKSMSYSYGPPRIQIPTHELYAEWLVSKNRLEEAMIQYDYALERGPKRIKVLKSQWSIAKQLNAIDKSQNLEKIIDDIMSNRAQSEKSL